MTLVRVEIRRILARRMAAAVAAAGVLALLLVLVGVWRSVQPLTADQIAEGERAYQQELEWWEENGEQMIADCLEAERSEEELTGQDMDFGCEQQTPPQREWFIPEPAPMHETVVPQVAAFAVLLAFLTFLVGVTSTAAEISTGALGTWLTFVPRRMLVLATKLTAAAAVTVPLTAALVGITVAGLWAINQAYGLTGGMTPTLWGDLLWLSVRIVVLGGVAGLLGAALGVLLRHTAAALGVVVGYVLVVESMVAGLLPGLQPYLLRTNAAAWVSDGATYWVNTCTVTDMGTTCESVEKTVSLLHGATVLGLVGVALVVVTAAVFRRRDVA